MKRTALKRKTLLRAKTQLRAKQWGIKKKRPKSPVPEGSRLLVFERVKGICEVCHERIYANPASDEWEDHHVFYRSHVARRVRHELWNRVALHRGCHRRAHQHLAVRERLEQLAVKRLYEYLGPEMVERVTRWIPEGATTPAAFVRAYEGVERFMR